MSATHTALTLPWTLDLQCVLSITKESMLQVYGGCTYVNSRKDAHPQFEYVPGDRLPPLWLMHAATPSESGKMHAPVRERWKAGDEAILSGMRDLAALADTARCDACRAQHRSLHMPSLSVQNDMRTRWLPFPCFAVTAGAAAISPQSVHLRI
jgi:hypothetical protein